MACLAVVMLQRLFLTSLFFIFVTSLSEFECHSKHDCEHLGDCIDKTCQCYQGFRGPSCAQIDVLPSTAKDEFSSALWPPNGGFQSGSKRTYAWGFTAVRDPHVENKLHAVVNTGCYIPTDGMVMGTFLLHLVSTNGPFGPWIAQGIVAPSIAFNPHLIISPDGEFVLYFRTNIQEQPPNWTESACSGLNSKQWNCLVKQGFYMSNSDLTDPTGNFVAVSKSMSVNDWRVTPFKIVGEPETCTNKSIISHNSNPSAVFLKSGEILLAYRYTFHGGSESVNVAISDKVEGPYHALFPCNYSMTSNTWGEDPFIWQSARDGSLHVYYHCMRYGHSVPNSPALHAFSPNIGGDGRGDWFTTKSPSHTGVYSTNISLANNSYTDFLYHRRERPDILFDKDGNPTVIFNALQETAKPEDGGKWGWSFSFGQKFNSM